MIDMNQLQTMDTNDVVSLAKLLLAIALSDGEAHAAEVALIQNFYEGCTEGETTLPTFAEIQAGAAQANQNTVLTQVSFTDSSLNEVAMSFMVLTALADGVIGKDEHQAIITAATSLGYSNEDVAHRIDAVKDQMMSQLSHLPDTASVVDVSRELNQS